jgi:hypothetical protein
MADEQKPRNGFTVSELENKVKKYGIEICLCTVFVLTAIFTLVWGGAMILWSILLCMILGIIGALFPKHVKKYLHTAMDLTCKEKVSSISTAIVAVLLSIFLPVIIFSLVGLIAGKSIALHVSGCSGSCSENK